MKIKTLVALAAACVGLVPFARATTITWDFMENGANKVLGYSSTFVESGYSLTAYGWVISDNKPSKLYSKWDSAHSGETGLGMLKDIGSDFEIDSNHFIQLDSVITPAGLGLNSMALESVQFNEDAGVYGSNAIGTLGTFLTSVAANGTIDLTSFVGFRYINVTTVGTAPLGNVLISSVTATSLPDGGTTALLLGLGLLGMGFLARRRS